MLVLNTGRSPPVKSRLNILVCTFLISYRVDGYGWAEVYPDGWGIAYQCKKESFDFNIVCKVGSGNDSRVMARYLEEACDELRAGLEATIPPKAKL
jgi:hypothetical protein